MQSGKYEQQKSFDDTYHRIATEHIESSYLFCYQAYRLWF